MALIGTVLRGAPGPSLKEAGHIDCSCRLGAVPGRGGAPHYSCGVAGEPAGRVDSWIWSVRLAKNRTAASGACRAGHVKVNGARAKPAQAIRAGDEVRVREDGYERVVVVVRVIVKRVGAPVAVECYIDKSPPRPAREEVAAVAVRDRGAGRPTKRERRSIDKLLRRSTR
jgi:ribosome-associated heat shock protein Hsp15